MAAIDNCLWVEIGGNKVDKDETTPSHVAVALNPVSLFFAARRGLAQAHIEGAPPLLPACKSPHRRRLRYTV